MVTNKIKNIGVMVTPEDKELIAKASRLQRRSVASFVIGASIIEARKIIKQNFQVQEVAQTPIS